MEVLEVLNKYAASIQALATIGLIFATAVLCYATTKMARSSNTTSEVGFREVGRSTARRNDVDIAVVIMERHGQGAEAGRRKRKSKLESL